MVIFPIFSRGKPVEKRHLDANRRQGAQEPPRWEVQKAVVLGGIPFWGLQSRFKPLTLLDPDMIWYMIYDMIQIFVDILMIQILFEWLSWSTGIQTNKNYRISSCHPQILGFKQKQWFKRDQDFQNTNNSDFHSTVDSKFHGTHLDGFIFWVCKV